ncbi:hypothetical protein K474DRAFT_1660196 [Panus rudis PR-1116 ss-1]|nr:hypothetical protein K474DRAFT_1660196 [Panus rudis PR-1116 ss-1]
MESNASGGSRRVRFATESRSRGTTPPDHSASPTPTSSEAGVQTPDLSPTMYVATPMPQAETTSDASSELFGGQSATPPATWQVAVHVALAAVRHAHPQTRPFIWDLTVHPDSIRGPRVYGNDLPSPYVIPDEVLNQSATKPHSQELHITCSGGKLPWQIHILAQETPFITVRDTIVGIYRFLRLPVTREEREIIYSTRPGLREAIAEAFRARCDSVPEDQRKEEERKGIKRVDLLTDTVQFVGLSPGSAPHTLVMHVMPLSP